MNLKDILFPKKEEKRFYYANDSVPYRMAKTLYNWIPNHHENTGPIIVICIGTDRSTGDSLGPLVGSLVHEYNLKHIITYGTLENPIHAKNLHTMLSTIKEVHQNPFIIAVDACLGKESSIGSIITGVGPLKPGAAVQKKLPEVGDLYISGVVNMSGYMEYFVLQNTRLSIVMNMAKQISQAIRFMDFFIKKDIQSNTVKRQHIATTHNSMDK